MECGIVLDQLLVRCHGNKERQEVIYYYNMLCVNEWVWL